MLPYLARGSFLALSRLRLAPCSHYHHFLPYTKPPVGAGLRACGAAWWYPAHMHIVHTAGGSLVYDLDSCSAAFFPLVLTSQLSSFQKGLELWPGEERRRSKQSSLCTIPAAAPPFRGQTEQGVLAVRGQSGNATFLLTPPPWRRWHQELLHCGSFQQEVAPFTGMRAREIGPVSPSSTLYSVVVPAVTWMSQPGLSVVALEVSSCPRISGGLTFECKIVP